MAIAMSALLLFSVEPLVGRLLLPAFGGAPAVWATVIAFFQVVLLVGYAYAHLVATRLGTRAGIALHLAVLVVALVLTLLGPHAVADVRLPVLPVVPGPLLVLLVLIGPAAFALTATTPLISTWYGRARRADVEPGDTEPYWLYALSNGGSLVALLTYPLVIEPRIGLSRQRGLWDIGLGLLVVVIGLAGAVVLARVGPGHAMAPAADAVDPDVEPTPDRIDPSPRPSLSTRLRWIGLATVPAGLLSAVTNQVTTDLISAPLLWVIPLAVYLASFIVAFSRRGRRLVPAAVLAAPAALTLLWIPTGSSGVWPVVPLLAGLYLGLGVIATALHGRLADLRPPDRHLTSFYLHLSVGGAIGGLFVALVAPAAFKGVWELPILVVLAFVALAVTAPPTPTLRPLRAVLAGAPLRVGIYLVAVVPMLVLIAASGGQGFAAAWRWAAVGGLILVAGGVPRFLALTTGVVLVLATFVLPPAALFRDRSFFGVVEVLRTDTTTILMHGTTVHGVEPLVLRDPPDPGSYYARSGPVGDIFDAWAARPAGVIRVVGLGAGAIAVYGRPDDDMAFFEIDPLIVRVAEDPALFTYLADRATPAEVRVGDGRLLVAGEADASVDLLLMDAFSSDTPPVHLFTLEAIEDANRALAPDGLLAVHVSNRYYDLGPPISAALHAVGLTVLEREYVPTEAEAAGGAGLSDWLLGTRDPDAIGRLRAAGWVDARIADAPLTDDFPDLLRWFGR